MRLWIYKRIWDVLNEIVVASCYTPPPINRLPINSAVYNILKYLGGGDYHEAARMRYGEIGHRVPVRYYNDGVNVYERFVKWYNRRVRWW